MEQQTTISSEQINTMSSAQLSILILLLLERIFKMFVNSKCYKHLEINLFGLKVIDVNLEEQTTNKDEEQSTNNE